MLEPPPAKVTVATLAVSPNTLYAEFSGSTAPIGVAVVSGMLASTFLLFVPAFFAVLERLAALRSRSPATA